MTAPIYAPIFTAADVEGARNAERAGNELLRRGTEAMTAGDYPKACAMFLMILAGSKVAEYKFNADAMGGKL